MPDQKQSILLGAAVVALLSTSYLGLINCLCCAGIVIGAVVAVWHYTETHRLTIKPGQGAVMGLVAALIGIAIAFVLNYVLIQLGIRSDQAIIQWVLDQFGDNMPPEQYDELVAQRDQPVTFGGLLLSTLPQFVVGAIFGAIGGAVGASVFKKGAVPPESPSEDLL